MHVYSKKPKQKKKPIHVVRLVLGYTSIQQKARQLLATTSITVPGEYRSWRWRVCCKDSSTACCWFKWRSPTPGVLFRLQTIYMLEIGICIDSSVIPIGSAIDQVNDCKSLIAFHTTSYNIALYSAILYGKIVLDQYRKRSHLACIFGHLKAQLIYWTI